MFVTKLEVNLFHRSDCTGMKLRVLFFVCTSSVIRQKGESQNEGNKNTKHAKFSEKTNI